MRVILHAGLPKTGTSAFQTWVRRNRDALRAATGIRYARFRIGGKDIAHNDMALRIGTGRPKARAELRAALRRALAEAGPDETLLVSAEDLSKYVLADPGESGLAAFRRLAPAFHYGQDAYWTARRRYVAGLAELFEGTRPEIWMTVRRQDSFCASLYRQSVRNRPYVGTPADMAASDLAFFDYLRVYRDWRAAFDDVRLFVYEDHAARPGRIVDGYLEALGAGADLRATIDGRSVNTSPHPDILEFMRRANHFPIDRPAVWTALLDWARARGLDAAGSEFDLLAPEARAALLARYADRNAELRAVSGVATPGRTTLFPDPEPSGRPLYGGLADETFEEICRALRLNPDAIT